MTVNKYCEHIRTAIKEWAQECGWTEQELNNALSITDEEIISITLDFCVEDNCSLMDVTESILYYSNKIDNSIFDKGVY